jgi:hypothetical protein
VTLPEEQTNFRRNVLCTFPLSADVSAEQEVLLLVVCGRAAKYERVLRLTCASLRPVFLLGSNGDRIGAKVEIKVVGRV